MFFFNCLTLWILVPKWLYWRTPFDQVGVAGVSKERHHLHQRYWARTVWKSLPGIFATNVWSSTFVINTLWHCHIINFQGRAPGLLPGEEFTTVAVKMLKVNPSKIMISFKTWFVNSVQSCSDYGKFAVQYLISKTLVLGGGKWRHGLRLWERGHDSLRVWPSKHRQAIWGEKNHQKFVSYTFSSKNCSSCQHLKESCFFANNKNKKLLAGVCRGKANVPPLWVHGSRRPQ